ncbi:MAG: HIT family protein [Chloroflexi bacterium]|nr:HIT family protein [Chloroflexota bacterium]
MDAACIFCKISGERVVIENDSAYVIYDAYPVTPFHALVIPKRHVRSFFELSENEISACCNLLHRLKALIEKEDPEVKGFNIGINDGDAAGQSVFHCHIHLIPRRTGDIENPRGGVRHIIPHRGSYREP